MATTDLDYISESGIDLDKLIQEEKIVNYNPTCVRKVSNWSKSSKIYRFDNPAFDAERLLKDLPEKSPKLERLLQKIDELDKKDMKKDGKMYKHFIFSDLKSGAYGAKLIASALIAKGMTLGYSASENVKEKSESAKSLESESDSESESKGGKKSTSDSDSESEEESEEEESDSDSESEASDSDSESETKTKTKKVGEKVLEKAVKVKKTNKHYNPIQLFTPTKLASTKGNNFYLLCSTSVYEQKISVKDKKEILRRFNQRPENIQGELSRIIIMDRGFKEGIDLFDIKYIHIYEPSDFPADQKQVIGRGTRTCGQRGLNFHPTRGWPLYVYVYDLSFPKSLQPGFLGTESAMELYLKSMNIDTKRFNFAHDLEKTTVLGSVDYELNKNIHSFSIPNDDDEEETLPPGAEFVYNGGDPKTRTVGEFEDHVSGGADKKPKKRLNLRSKVPAFVVGSREEHEETRKNFKEMRDYVQANFKEYTWDPVKMENLCADKKKGGGTEIMKYTPTQDFVSHYFTPESPIKGMLLNHSVGTGKTCSAIAIATSTFEKQGYTILWVTKHTLKNDIWKNMFEQVCHAGLAEQMQTLPKSSQLKIPADQNKRIRLLSPAWRIRPMSYKQFSNLVAKKNAFYETLVKLHGEADPLKKTLIIIDEAHKLYGGETLSLAERPDMHALHQALMNSYEISRKDSVKVLLMTATPITQDPMELIRLLNLCRTMREQLPCEFADFSKEYLSDSGEFTEKGRSKYLDDISGYVSYLNREKDARQFAQPQIEHIKVPITDDLTNAKRFDKRMVREFMDSDIAELKTKIEEKSNEITEDLEDLDANRFSYLKEEFCGHLVGKKKKQCMDIVKSNIKLLIKESSDEVRRIRDTIKEIRESMQNRNLLKKTVLSEISENIEKYAGEYEDYKSSMVSMLKNKCSVKTTESPLKTVMKDHPVIKGYDERLEALNTQIDDLKQRLKNDMTTYKNRIEHLREILKKDLSELEKSVITITLREERKTFRKIINLKKKETTKAIKTVKKSIKTTENLRTKKYKTVRNTIKKQIAKDKKEKTATKTAEKKLRKTLRKQDSIKEEIDDELLKGLLEKYTGKIKEEVSQIDGARSTKKSLHNVDGARKTKKI
jgi:hypothetical protein